MSARGRRQDAEVRRRAAAEAQPARAVEAGPSQSLATAVVAPTWAEIAGAFALAAAIAVLALGMLAGLAAAVLDVAADLTRHREVIDVGGVVLLIGTIAAAVVHGAAAARSTWDEVVAVGPGWLTSDRRRTRWVRTDRIVDVRREASKCVLRDESGREVRVPFYLLLDDDDEPLAQQFGADFATSLARGLTLPPDDPELLYLNFEEWEKWWLDGDDPVAPDE